MSIVIVKPFGLIDRLTLPVLSVILEDNFIGHQTTMMMIREEKRWQSWRKLLSLSTHGQRMNYSWLRCHRMLMKDTIERIDISLAE